MNQLYTGSTKAPRVSVPIKKLFPLILVWILASYGCKKFVAIDPPRTQIISPEVFNDSSTTVAAMLSIYAQLRDEGMLNGTRSTDMGLYADEMIHYSTTLLGSPAFYNNSITSTSGEASSIWNVAYSHIYMINNLLEGVQHSAGLTEGVKKTMRGEGLFLRSLLHFNLVNYFGAVPFIDTTDYRINKIKVRMPMNPVYNRVIQDLLEAEKLISARYESGERTRANVWVVRALLARVYLYKKDWDKAIEKATQLIDYTAVYKIEDVMDKTFLKESLETIWHFKPALEGMNTVEQSAIYKDYTPIPLRFSFSKSFMRSFEPTDKRKEKWTTYFVDGVDSFFYPYKYKQGATKTETSKEYSIIFRLAEQYLIRAEARAQLLNISGAREDINKIRQRAGLGITPAADKESLLAAILQERRVELFYEFSHRWFDLKRIGLADNVLKTIKRNWTITDTILPIPQSEILANPNLAPQNPGYN